MRLLPMSNNCIRQLVFAPAGDVLVALDVAPGPFIGVWNWPLAAGNKPVLHRFRSPCGDVSPDGRRLAVLDALGTVVIRNAANREMIALLVGTASWRAESLLFAPDGKTLLVVCDSQSATDDKLVRVVGADHSTLHELPAPPFLNGCMFLPDGRTVAAFARDGVEFWQWLTTSRLTDWRTNSDVRRLLFTPDGQTAALAAGDFLQLWDVPAGRQRQTLLGHRGPVNCLAVSPDGRTLASGGEDRTVRFWELPTGKLARTFEWPTGPVHALAFAPDGLTAAAGGESGEVVIWDVDE